MYGLMVVFEPTRPTAVYGGRNEGINFGNVTVEPETGGSGIMVAAAEQSERLSVGSVGGVPYEKGRSETCRGQIKQEKGWGRCREDTEYHHVAYHTILR